MAKSTVICKTISDFRNHCFESGDKFRYAVIVPQSTLEALENTDEYGYVSLSTDENGDSRTLVQVMSFSNEHDTTQFSTDNIPWACIRTKLQREIGLDPENDDGMRVHIKECETTSLDGLNVHRVSAWEQQDRDITTEGLAGYITSEDMEEVQSLERGDICEIINPQTGARIQHPIETYEHKNRKRETIRLNGITRKLLEVDSKDEGENNEVRLRVLTENERTESGKNKIYNWIGRQFVDYSRSHFQVLPGYDRDEGRNVVRINEDAMKGLGIDENDRVVLSWINDGKKTRNVRCQSGWEEDKKLQPETATDSSYGEAESLSVRVPSTERDALNISVGDSISIRRDMRYQAGKQVSLSAFGILGVIVGTNQLISMLLEEITITYISLSVASVFMLSIATIWLIMSPIRQKCRTPE